MNRSTLYLTDRVYNYLLEVSLREHPLLKKLHAETAGHEFAGMQIAPEQGQLIALLISLINARRIIELGVFTGYSSLCMALALPDDGKIIACDINEEYTSKAKSYWQEAGVADKIELRLAPALETLADLLAAGEAGNFDLIFVDAVKEEYLEYYEYALQLIRQNGIMIFDNVLWSGDVADPADQSPETTALRKFNKKLHDDDRIDISLLPIGDGLTLARKR